MGYPLVAPIHFSPVQRNTTEYTATTTNTPPTATHRAVQWVDGRVEGGLGLESVHHIVEALMW